MDETGRVVGWSMDGFFPPTVAAPYVWTAAGGMVDLAVQGFPAEQPLAVSPAGMVATINNWYSLDDPASVTAVTAPPVGYLLSAYPATINDAGEQARFLVSTGPENLVYLFRYHTDGTWEQISLVGNGLLSPMGIGSIDSAGTVTSTILGGGMIAWGPDGDTEDLTAYVSSAYVGAAVTWAGPINEAGEILAQVSLGLSPRLMRMVPADPCVGSCLKVNKLTLTTKFVENPNNPGACTANGPEHNAMRAKVTITDANGVTKGGVKVTGRFLDNYYTDNVSTVTTNNKGVATFSDTGPCGVGTLTFLVTDAVKTGFTFDRTTGTLVASDIP
jgi:hypothetical protein